MTRVLALLVALLSVACIPTAVTTSVRVDLSDCRTSGGYFDATATVDTSLPYALRLEYHRADGSLLADGSLGVHASRTVAVHDGPGFDPEHGLTARVTADVDGERYASASCEVRQ